MVRRILLQIGLAAALLASAGCSSAPSLEPKGRVDVPLETDAERVQVKVKLANVIVIQLPPVTKRDEQWTVVLNDERFLRQMGRIQRVEAGYTASFLAIRPGRRPIRFLTVPPDVREAVPTQRYDVLIEIE